MQSNPNILLSFWRRAKLSFFLKIPIKYVCPTGLIFICVLDAPAYRRHWISQRVWIVAPVHLFKSGVRCHVSGVTCHLSYVTNANSHSHGPSPSIHSRMLLLILTWTHQQWVVKTKKIKFFCTAICGHFWDKIANYETNVLSILFPK